MPYQQLSFSITAEEYKAIANLLDNMGALTLTLTDAEDQPLYEPAPGSTPLWDHSRILALFPEKMDLTPVITILKKLHYSDILIEQIKDKAWERVCLDQFQPIRFGENFWICPSWHEINLPNATVVKLDPGLAFGTGTHPTTHLCVEWLATHQPLLTRKTVIDYGCGSGILAISAKKLGAQIVYAVDNDPQALEATQENADNNHVPLAVLAPAQFATAFQGQQADILIANILAGPLITLAPLFLSYLKPESQLILSGILENQVQSVLQAYTPRVTFDPPVLKEEWARLSGTVASRLP